MKFLITQEDSKKIKILKLFYLIPLFFIKYPILILIEGIKEVGNPFSDLIQIIKEITGKDNRK